MADVKTFVVVLEEKETKQKYTISYEGLRRALKTDERIDYVFKRIIEIENALIKSLMSQARLDIIALIRKQPKMRTGEINKFCINRERFVYNAYYKDAYYKAFEELKTTGEIISKSHGRGKQRTWFLSPELINEG